MSEPWFREVLSRMPIETKHTIRFQLLNSLAACTGISDLQSFSSLRQQYEYIDEAVQTNNFWPIIGNASIYMLRIQKENPANSSLVITDVSRPSGLVSTFEKIDRLFGQNLGHIASEYASIFKEEFNFSAKELEEIDLPAKHIILAKVAEGNRNGLR